MKNTMRYLWICFIGLSLSSFQCEEDVDLPVFVGKLAVAGICGNYTIELVRGDLPPGLYENTWVDPQTNLNYQKAFRLGNFCDFPSTIQQGEEFYFSLESNPSAQCATCMAYYPTPQRAIAIRVR